MINCLCMFQIYNVLHRDKVLWALPVKTIGMKMGQVSVIVSSIDDSRILPDALHSAIRHLMTCCILQGKHAITDSSISS